MLSLVEDDKLNLEEKCDLIEKEKMTLTRDLHLLKEDVKDKDMELEELKIKVNIQKSYLLSSLIFKICWKSTRSKSSETILL